MMTATVYFCKGTIIPKKRVEIPVAVGVAVASILGRSPYGHVAIELGGRVLDPQYTGDRLYPKAVYEKYYPNILQVAYVPFGGSIARDCQKYTGHRCGYTVCDVLGLIGVDIPRMNIPGNIFRWLVKNGYRTQKFERP